MGKALGILGFVLGFAVIPANVALKGLTSISMNFLWGSMNDMSFLTILSLISITVPGIAQIIQAVILKFLYLDILMTDEWLYPLLLSEEDSLYDTSLPDNPDDDTIFIDKGINNYFDENGISSMFSIKNLGSTLVYLAFIAVAFLLLIISYILQGLFGIFESTHKFIKKNMMWNFTLRLLIQQFQPIIMFAIINLYHLDNSINIYLSSTVLTFLQLIVGHLVIPIMAVAIYSHD